MNIAYKGEKLCYYDVATGKYLDPETLEETKEKVVEEPVAEAKNGKKIK